MAGSCIIIISMHTRLHRVRHWVRRWYPLFFLLVAIVFGTVSLFALRNNNSQMAVYRQAVYDADKRGDAAELEAALRTLRHYVYNHMNTSLTSGNNAVYPPIQLQYTYERAQAAQQQQHGQVNANLYHQAQEHCTGQYPGSAGATIISCIEEYTAAHGITLSEIPDALYKFDFVSAKWSPDLAGWSVVITITSFGVFLFSSAYRWWAKRSL